MIKTGQKITEGVRDSDPRYREVGHQHQPAQKKSPELKSQGSPEDLLGSEKQQLPYLLYTSTDLSRDHRR